MKISVKQKTLNASTDNKYTDTPTQKGGLGRMHPMVTLSFV